MRTRWHSGTPTGREDGETFPRCSRRLAPKIVRDSEQTEALTPCGAREYCAALYGSGGLYEDPWRISPELLSLNLTDLVLQCSVSASQPLGAQTVRVFRDGGYASIRTPLLAAESSLPCFGSGQTEICVQQSPSPGRQHSLLLPRCSGSCGSS